MEIKPEHVDEFIQAPPRRVERSLGLVGVWRMPLFVCVCVWNSSQCVCVCAHALNFKGSVLHRLCQVQVDLE